MLYISGPNDTLRSLKEREAFKGDVKDYITQFAKLNPELNITTIDRPIPSYTPFFLVSTISRDSSNNETLKAINTFSKEERQELYSMQENHYDVLTQISLTSFMEKFQSYASGVRKWLKMPLILTPWTDLNNALNNKSLFKIFSESSNYGATILKDSKQMRFWEPLYEDMLTKDILNRKLHLLREEKGSEVSVLKKNVNKQVKELSAKIKQQIPKKIDENMQPFLRKFTPEEIRRMRANSYSLKAARGGKIFTLELDVLNRSGIERLRKMIQGLRTVGQKVSSTTKVLNYGLVGYDTYQAYLSGDKAAKTFITGATSIYVTSQAVSALGGTAALGGYIVSALGADAALGMTVMVCCPILGWCVLLVGIAAAGYMGYQAKNVFERTWDIGEDGFNYVYKEVTKVMSAFYKHLTQDITSLQRREYYQQQ